LEWDAGLTGRIRRYGQVYVGPSLIHGEGTFAAEDIAAGERIWAVDDSNVVPEGADYEEVELEHRHHCDDIAGGRKVILKEPDRWVNHSCRPNINRQTIDGVRYEIALRDIRAGEELTHDYRINGGGDSKWKCNCGSDRCAGTVHSDFFRAPVELQVEYLPLLDDWFVAENLERVEELRARLDGRT
jgi:SET domain-containing protein